MSEVVYVVREFAIPANGSWPIDITAKYVTVYNADGAINIGFDDGDPQFIEAGISVPTSGFEKVVIEDASGALNNVQVAFSNLPVRDGRFKMSGSFTVSVPDGLDVNNFPTPQFKTDVEQMGQHIIGANKATFSFGGAKQTIFTPAQNTNGAIVRSLTLAENGGGYSNVHVSDTEPLSQWDGNSDYLFMTVSFGHQFPNLPLEIPAGQGLWVTSNGNLHSTVTWDWKS